MGVVGGGVWVGGCRWRGANRGCRWRGAGGGVQVGGAGGGAGEGMWRNCRWRGAGLVQVNRYRWRNINRGVWVKACK